jgi:excisionase family DNA binding protein
VEYLTIGQVAEQLGISEITVRRRIKKGKIKAEMLQGEFGEQYFITQDELEKHKVATTSIEVIELEKAITPTRLQEFLDNALKSKITPLEAKINQLEDTNIQLIQEIQELKEILIQKEEPKSFWKRFF